MATEAGDGGGADGTDRTENAGVCRHRVAKRSAWQVVGPDGVLGKAVDHPRLSIWPALAPAP
jgi:hypothetical protein